MKEIDKSWCFKVVESNTPSMSAGDKVSPVKLIGGKWMIGHNYRRSLPFNFVNDNQAECVSELTGKILARIERIK